jgi:hypothetical protein
MKELKSLRSWARVRVCWMVAGALLAVPPSGGFRLPPPGGVTTARAVEQIMTGSTRPLPSVAPREVARPDMVWVPDRWIVTPEEPTGVRVPAHWEQRISEGRVYVPPLLIFHPTEGVYHVAPAAVKEPAESRTTP